MKPLHLLPKLKRALLYFNTYGALSTLKKLILSSRHSAFKVESKIARKFSRFAFWSHKDIALKSFLYNYILNKAENISIQADDCYVTWVVPEYGPSSGGHRTIFRHISGLKKLGISSRLLILETNNFFSAEQAQKNLPSDIDLSGLQIEIAREKSVLSSTIIVTSWHTAYWARSIAEKQSCRAFYFIQDHESLFYSSGSLSTLAQATYEMPYKHIYASSWLAKKVPGNSSTLTNKCIVNLGVDIHEFWADETITKDREKRLLENEILEIGIYYRPVTPRRMEEHAYLLLEYFSRSRINMRLHFFGWDWSKHEWPSESQWHKSHGVLKHAEISKLLDRLDCCILLGSTNVSLMPLETMAAGLPTFVNEGENNSCLLEDLPLYFSCLPHIGFNQIVDSLNNRKLLVDKMKHGIEHARSMSWEMRSREFLEALNS